MTTAGGSGGGITKNGRKRLSGACCFTIVIFGLGLYAGLATAKQALIGPEWQRRVTGLTSFGPTVAIPPDVHQAVQQMINDHRADQSDPTQPQPPGAQIVPDKAPVQQRSDTNPTLPGKSPDVSQGNINQTSQPQVPTGSKSLTGAWEVTDELHPLGSKATTVTSRYEFEEGGSGEFDTNGKKLYSIHWEDAGEYLLITFVTDLEGEQNLKVKMNYSLNPDGTLLTMIPTGKKDPRSELYGVTMGVYHRK